MRSPKDAPKGRVARKAPARKRPAKAPRARGKTAREAAGKAGKKKGEDRLVLASELAHEIGGLRTVLADIVEIYRSRVDGQLAGLAEVFQHAADPDAPLPPVKAEAAMLAALRSLKIKPRKGRAKDLVRLGVLAEALWTLAGG